MISTEYETLDEMLRMLGQEDSDDDEESEEEGRGKRRKRRALVLGLSRLAEHT